MCLYVHSLGKGEEWGKWVLLLAKCMLCLCSGLKLYVCDVQYKMQCDSVIYPFQIVSKTRGPMPKHTLYFKCLFSMYSQTVVNFLTVFTILTTKFYFIEMR